MITFALHNRMQIINLNIKNLNREVLNDAIQREGLNL